jgi:hypothetical protein
VISLPCSNVPTAGQLFGENLRKLLELTSGDIELLLTVLYQLNDHFFAHSPHGSLERAFIERVLASGSLPEFFVDPADCQQALNVLELLLELADQGNVATAFWPGNFFRLFQGVLFDYFQESFQRYPCPRHAGLFDILSAQSREQ